MASRGKKLSATGDVETVTVYLKSVVFEHSAAATLDLRAGGSGGTVQKSLRLAAAGQVEWTAGDDDGETFAGGLHATLSAGTASFEYAKKG